MSRTEELRRTWTCLFVLLGFARNVSGLETRMVEPQSICVDAVEVAARSPMVVEAK